MICVVVNSQSISCHKVREHTEERFSLSKPCSCTIFSACVTDHQWTEGTERQCFDLTPLQLLSAPSLQHAWVWFYIITRLKQSHISFRSNLGQLLLCVCVYKTQFIKEYKLENYPIFLNFYYFFQFYFLYLLFKEILVCKCEHYRMCLLF